MFDISNTKQYLLAIKTQVFSASVKQLIEVQDSVVPNNHLKIIDGTGKASLSNQDIVYVKNRIQAIGVSGKISIPRNAKIIDAAGKTIIPCLIMLGEQLFYGNPFEGNYKGIHMTCT